MGGKHSFPLPRYGFCIRPENPHRCRENHARVGSSRKRKSRTSQSDLVPPPSADASFIGDPTTYGLLDINAATAEEFMTLPGINRTTATSIVDYRRQIGFFRKIEDMALVPGVGATRFGHVRAEICVGDIEAFFVTRSSLVRSGSSATSSGIDVSVTPADNESREYYGDGVLSFGGRTFGRSSVTDSFSCGSPPTAFSIGGDSDRVSGEDKNNTADVLDDVTAGLLRHETKTCTPVAVENSGRLDTSQVQVPVRVATWNVLPCSPEKVDNGDFRQVFSRTLLENSLSIVAVQGVTDLVVLQKLCDELNSSTVPSGQGRGWSGHRGPWLYASSSSSSSSSTSTEHTSDNVLYGGVFYDVSQGVELQTTASPCSDLFQCTFKTSRCDSLIVAVWCGQSFNNNLSLISTTDTVAELVQDAKAFVLLVGDFGFSAEEPESACLRRLNLSAALRPDQFTDVSLSNVSGTRCSENIWTSEEASLHCKAVHVGRQCLMTSEGGAWSGQCPVWAEFL